MISYQSIRFFHLSDPCCLCLVWPVFPGASVHGKGRQHRDEQRNLHFFAPEYGCKCDEGFCSFISYLQYCYWRSSNPFLLLFTFLASEDDYAIDIFSFGICALEVRGMDINKIPISLFLCMCVWVLANCFSLQMAVLEIQANGDSAVSKEAIVNAGQSLEDPLMRVSIENTLCSKYTLV